MPKKRNSLRKEFLFIFLRIISLKCNINGNGYLTKNSFLSSEKSIDKIFV